MFYKIEASSDGFSGLGVKTALAVPAHPGGIDKFVNYLERNAGTMRLVVEVSVMTLCFTRDIVVAVGTSASKKFLCLWDVRLCRLIKGRLNCGKIFRRMMNFD